MTRRWRTSSLNTWAREGESAYHVQYVVEHPGCATEAQQRSAARRFATAESMWEARHDLWPGEVLLDRVALLGIEPGSRAPAGWPPAPTPPPTVKPEHPVPSAAPPNTAPSAPTSNAPSNAPTNAPAPNPQVAPTPPLPPPPSFGAAGTEETKSCSVGHHGDAPLWLFALALAIAWRRRRRD